jgi:hypothetical protein
VQTKQGRRVAGGGECAGRGSRPEVLFQALRALTSNTSRESIGSRSSASPSSSGALCGQVPTR